MLPCFVQHTYCLCTSYLEFIHNPNPAGPAEHNDSSLDESMDSHVVRKGTWSAALIVDFHKCALDYLINTEKGIRSKVKCRLSAHFPSIWADELHIWLMWDYWYTIFCLESDIHSSYPAIYTDGRTKCPAQHSELSSTLLISLGISILPP